MHVRRNNEFYGVFVFIEEPDDEMLERNGLDDNGALYKVYNEFTSASTGFSGLRDASATPCSPPIIQTLAGIPLI